MTLHRLTPKLGIQFTNNRFQLLVARDDGLITEENEIPIELYQALLNWHNILNNVKSTESLIADNEFLETQLLMAQSEIKKLKIENNHAFNN